MECKERPPSTLLRKRFPKGIDCKVQCCGACPVIEHCGFACGAPQFIDYTKCPELKSIPLEHRMV